MQSGQYSLSEKNDSYSLVYDEELGEQVVEWNINASVTGWRCVSYDTFPIDFSEAGSMVLALRSDQVGAKVDFRLGSEKPWANVIGWQFTVGSKGWVFYELNMSQFDPSLTAGIFNLSDVIHFQLGFAVKSQGSADVKIDFLILSSSSVYKQSTG